VSRWYRTNPATVAAAHIRRVGGGNRTNAAAAPSPDCCALLPCVSERVAGGYRAVWLVPELPEAAGEEVPLDGVLGEE
jgi:hypothetical protein